MSEIILDVKPKFYMLPRIVANLKKEVVLTLALEGLFMMIIMVVLIATNNPTVANLVENNQDELIVYSYILMMGLIMFIFPVSVLLLGFLDKKNFEATSYKIYNDKIDFEEGFINHKHSSILFKDVKEIHLDQNFIQRKYNVATVRFITASNNPMGETSIRFQDIENAQYVYTKVKEIHEG